MCTPGQETDRTRPGHHQFRDKLGHSARQCRPGEGRSHGFGSARGLVIWCMIRGGHPRKRSDGLHRAASSCTRLRSFIVVGAHNLAASVLLLDRPGQWGTQDQYGCADSLGREACLAVWMCGFDNGQLACLQGQCLFCTKHGPDRVKQQARKINLQGP